MTDRKKRLKKGISSLQKQVELHEEKKKQAEEENNEDLVRYYEKEIEAKEKTKQEKQAILDKQ
ncbi:MAG: hypothetical protein Q7S33_05260 [Nanoarchaeota archaeon]|nr:hypothetical protein [Nanoarchaeota archaeon]